MILRPRGQSALTHRLCQYIQAYSHLPLLLSCGPIPSRITFRMRDSVVFGRQKIVWPLVVNSLADTLQQEAKLGG